jgi:hypothetical protein
VVAFTIFGVADFCPLYLYVCILETSTVENGVGIRNGFQIENKKIFMFYVTPQRVQLYFLSAIKFVQF